MVASPFRHCKCENGQIYKKKVFIGSEQHIQNADLKCLPSLFCTGFCSRDTMKWGWSVKTKPGARRACDFFLPINSISSFLFLKLLFWRPGINLYWLTMRPFVKLGYTLAIFNISAFIHLKTFRVEPWPTKSLIHINMSICEQLMIRSSMTWHEPIVRPSFRPFSNSDWHFFMLVNVFQWKS